MIDGMKHVCWAEALKLRRSRAPQMSAVAYAMAPVAAALLLLVTEDPSKAVPADWPGYLSLLASATAVGGYIVFGLFLTWIFGREHTDRTSKELLTLPVPREMFVAGKILLAAAWCLVLQASMLVVALALGAILELPGWSGEDFLGGARRMLSVAGLTFCLALPLGWVANLSRGTMTAVGALCMSSFFALVMIAVGWGHYFPWSVPLLYSGAGGALASSMGLFSFCTVILTGLAGVLGNMAWWHWADQR